MKKKTYAKPILAVEEFTTEFFCAVCNKKFTDLHNYGIYLDCYPYGTSNYYDKGHEYMESTGHINGAIDGVYTGVKAYHLLRSPFKSGDLIEYNSQLANSHEYTTSIFTFNGAEKPRYQFVMFPNTYDIIIKDSVVYYNRS